MLFVRAVINNSQNFGIEWGFLSQKIFYVTFGSRKLAIEATQDVEVFFYKKSREDRLCSQQKKRRENEFSIEMHFI